MAETWVGLTPMEGRLATIERAAQRTESLGYVGLSVAEGWTLDATAVLAYLTTTTHRTRLASGIMSVWARTPATIAMAALTLDRLSGSRFELGLGASSPQLVEGFHGLPYERPIAQVRRTLVEVRSLLGGGRAAVPHPEVRALRLGDQPSGHIPIHLAGMHPSTIRLAGELADTWFPFFIPLSFVDEGRALLAEGAAERDDAVEPRCMPCVPVSVGETEAEARAGAAWWLGFYLMSMGSLYCSILERVGYRVEIDAVADINSGRRDDFEVPGRADRLLDNLVIHGTPDVAAQRLDAWTAATSSVGLAVPPGVSDEALDLTLEALAPSTSEAIT